MPYNPTRTHSARQDQWNVGLHIGGNSYGLWDKKTGGEVDSDEVVYWPGGMNPKIVLGGRVTPGNITLQKLFDGVDDAPYLPTLINGAGKLSCKVTLRPLDLDGNPYGKTVIWSGKLKRVLVPDVDSEAQSPALIELEIVIEGVPTVA